MSSILTNSARILRRISFALALSLFHVGATPRLSLPNVSASPGSGLLIAVSLATEGKSISSIQFDLLYDPAVIDFSITPGDATRTALKTIHSKKVRPGMTRFLIVGLNRTTLQDEAVINLILYVNPQAHSGAYPLKLASIFFASPEGQAVTASTADGGVLVSGDRTNAVPIGPAGVVNAASMIPGPIAPGEFVTLFGSAIVRDPTLPPTVLFDSRPSPAYLVEQNQINVAAPFEIALETATHLKLVWQGTRLADIVRPVAAAAPGVFTLDGSGVGPGAILNEDSTVNSFLNPAARGSVAVLYASGAGETLPAGVDGKLSMSPPPHPVLPVSVELDGIPVPVLYAGAAPGFLQGLLQVNFRVPRGIHAGDTIPVILKVGSFNSQAGVTMTIK
jgi:uncharacterized protein (TIGR03437 family)